MFITWMKVKNTLPNLFAINGEVGRGTSNTQHSWQRSSIERGE